MRRGHDLPLPGWQVHAAPGTPPLVVQPLVPGVRLASELLRTDMAAAVLVPAYVNSVAPSCRGPVELGGHMMAQVLMPICTAISISSRYNFPKGMHAQMAR